MISKIHELSIITIIKMSKNIKYSIILLIFIANSCKKKDDVKKEEKPTTKDLLVNKKWYTTAVTISPAYMGITDMFKDLVPCQKDDSFTYKENGIKEIDNGALKCNQNDPQINNKTEWTINGNQLIHKYINGTQILRDTSNIRYIDNKKMELFFIQKINKEAYTLNYIYETK